FSVRSPSKKRRRFPLLVLRCRPTVCWSFFRLAHEAFTHLIDMRFDSAVFPRHSIEAGIDLVGVE
ncbi:hypothetical protein, partial [Tannerella sp.]|uniref:hypothetical protein n=1 Tax=Tannerella sp. TaxID=2382127 RepID=UPI0026DDB046